MEYVEVPGKGFWMSKTKALVAGNPVPISWYEVKLWIQKKGVSMMSSKEWYEARSYFQYMNPPLERDMRTGPVEFTDSLIAWPNPDDKYASNLNPEPKAGKYPILVENATVYRRSRTGTRSYDFVVDGGERTELPKLLELEKEGPFSLPEIGLVSATQVYSKPDFKIDEGLRPIIRGVYARHPLGPLYDMIIACDGPMAYSPDISFRTIKRGSLPPEPEENNNTNGVMSLAQALARKYGMPIEGGIFLRKE